MRPGGLSTLCRSSSPRGEGAGRGGRQRAQSRACAGAQGCESSWQARRRALLRSCAVWLKREQDRLRRPGFRCFLLLTVRSPAPDCRDSAYSSLSYSNRLAEPRPACTQVRGRLLAPFLQRVLDRSSFPRTQPQPRLGRPRARHAALPAARRSSRTRPRPAPPTTPRAAAPTTTGGSPARRLAKGRRACRSTRREEARPAHLEARGASTPV